MTAVAKPCAVCGRTMEPRKRWRDFDAVKYCSAACRGRRHLSDVDKALEKAVLELLAQRARGKTICPSEAARRVGDEDTWRALMERTRQAARRLVARGDIVITQKGRVVDPSTARGPLRLRLP